MVNEDKVCRMCLKRNLSKFFTIFYPDEYRATPFNYIENVIPELYLGHTEGIPMLCETCYEHLKNFYYFKQATLRAQELIELYMKMDSNWSRIVKLENVVSYWMTIHKNKQMSCSVSRDTLKQIFGWSDEMEIVDSHEIQDFLKEKYPEKPFRGLTVNGDMEESKRKSIIQQLELEMVVNSVLSNLIDVLDSYILGEVFFPGISTPSNLYILIHESVQDEALRKERAAQNQVKHYSDLVILKHNLNSDKFQVVTTKESFPVKVLYRPKVKQEVDCSDKNEPQSSVVEVLSDSEDCLIVSVQHPPVEASRSERMPQIRVKSMEKLKGQPVVKKVQKKLPAVSAEDRRISSIIEPLLKTNRVLQRITQKSKSPLLKPPSLQPPKNYSALSNQPIQNPVLTATEWLHRETTDLGVKSVDILRSDPPKSVCDLNYGQAEKFRKDLEDDGGGDHFTESSRSQPTSTTTLNPTSNPPEKPPKKTQKRLKAPSTTDDIPNTDKTEPNRIDIRSARCKSTNQIRKDQRKAAVSANQRNENSAKTLLLHKDTYRLFTNFTGEGDYINDHDYFRSPYKIGELVDRKFCICMLCGKRQLGRNHVKHMKSHKTKCQICNEQFENVFRMNLHAYSHCYYCHFCKTNVFYYSYHVHSSEHGSKYLEPKKQFGLSPKSIKPAISEDPNCILKLMLDQPPSNAAICNQLSTLVHSPGGSSTESASSSLDGHDRTSNRKRTDEALTINDLLRNMDGFEKNKEKIDSLDAVLLIEEETLDKTDQNPARTLNWPMKSVTDILADLRRDKSNKDPEPSKSTEEPPSPRTAATSKRTMPEEPKQAKSPISKRKKPTSDKDPTVNKKSKKQEEERPKTPSIPRRKSVFMPEGNETAELASRPVRRARSKSLFPERPKNDQKHEENEPKKGLFMESLLLKQTSELKPVPATNSLTTMRTRNRRKSLYEPVEELKAKILVRHEEECRSIVRKGPQTTAPFFAKQLMVLLEKPPCLEALRLSYMVEQLQERSSQGIQEQRRVLESDDRLAPPSETSETSSMDGPLVPKKSTRTRRPANQFAQDFEWFGTTISNIRRPKNKTESRKFSSKRTPRQQKGSRRVPLEDATSDSRSSKSSLSNYKVAVPGNYTMVEVFRGSSSVFGTGSSTHDVDIEG